MDTHLVQFDHLSYSPSCTDEGCTPLKAQHTLRLTLWPRPPVLLHTSCWFCLIMICWNAYIGTCLHMELFRNYRWAVNVWDSCFVASNLQHPKTWEAAHSGLQALYRTQHLLSAGPSGRSCNLLDHAAYSTLYHAVLDSFSQKGDR